MHIRLHVTKAFFVAVQRIPDPRTRQIVHLLGELYALETMIDAGSSLLEVSGGGARSSSVYN
jgi:hypothetical protein